jgi:surface protein
MSHLFYDSAFNGDISKWNVSNVVMMGWMFAKSEFTGDLSNWDVSNVDNMTHMFDDCPLQNNPPKWYRN